MKKVIELTPAEIQSGVTRVKWAEGLIRQLPEDHDGRNNWLLNYSAVYEFDEAPWNGEGLPPVSTVCELRSRGGGWGEAEIKYHGKGLCVWLWVRHDGSADQIEYAESPDRLEFRPIRTAEQIAAEERRRVIEEMVYGAAGCERDGQNTKAFLICGFLYDAGYRKVEQ